MNAVQARARVEQQIMRNPAGIVIRRSAEVSDGAGGSHRVTLELPAQTVRVFMAAYAGAREALGVGGHIETQRWGLLARWNADIRDGDEFAHGGRQFRVRAISPASTGGEATAIHAELEEVS